MWSLSSGTKSEQSSFRDPITATELWRGFPPTPLPQAHRNGQCQPLHHSPQNYPVKSTHSFPSLVSSGVTLPLPDPQFFTEQLMCPKYWPHHSLRYMQNLGFATPLQHCFDHSHITSARVRAKAESGRFQGTTWVISRHLEVERFYVVSSNTYKVLTMCQALD